MKLALCVLALAPCLFVDLVGAQCETGGSFAYLGVGTEGSVGVPRLELIGAPVQGRPFAFEVASGPAGATGFLAVGTAHSPISLAAFGVIAHPGGTVNFLPFQLDAAGTSPPLVELSPVSLALCGASFVGQAVIVDPAALGGLAFSRGASLTFGGPYDGFLLPGATLSLDNYPKWVHDGDFNHDGFPDAAVGFHEATYGKGAVTILLGHGNGRFTAAAPISFTRRLEELVVAEVDGNDHVDLIALLDYQTVVLFGQGDGTFVVGPLTTPNSADALGAADLDGDGHADLVVGNDDWVHIYLGQGDGTFLYRQGLYGYENVSRIRCAELTGDAGLDVVLGHWVPKEISVLRGYGDGTLVHHGEFAVPGVVRDIVVLDLDGEGDLDLAVTHTSVAGLSTFFNDGAGIFTPAATWSGEEPGALIGAELGGDGTPDLVVVVGYEAWLFHGKEDGHLSPGERVWIGGDVDGMAIADFDLDGAPDLLAAERTHDLAVFVPGTAAGSLEAPIRLDGPDGAQQILLTDLNGDQVDDVISLNLTSGNLTGFLNQGGGAFSPARSSPVDRSPVAFAVGELNGDGLVDAAVASSYFDGIQILRGWSTGHFADHSTLLPGVGTRDVALGDLDGDGDLDVVALEGFGAAVRLFLNDGLAQFTAVAAPAVSNDAEAVILTDLDHDGVLDLVVPERTNNTLEVFLGVGNGTFTALAPVPAGDDPEDVLAADLDENGVVDLVVNNRLTADMVLLGHGDGTFAPGLPVIGSDRYGDLAIVDFDRDGHLDLLQLTLDGLRLFRGGGDGTMGSPELFAGGGGFALAAGDLDGDAIPDVVERRWMSVGLQVFFNRMLR